MHYVVGGIFSLFVIALAVGAVTGRVRASSCCAPGDPALDARMRAASQEQPGTATGSQVSQSGSSSTRPRISALRLDEIFEALAIGR